MANAGIQTLRIFNAVHNIRVMKGCFMNTTYIFPGLRHQPYRGSARFVAIVVFVVVWLIAAGGQSSSAWASERSPVRKRPWRLLVDEYHHYPRPADFSQGLSLDTDLYRRSYAYSTDATATPNGLFILAQAIARDFRAQVSTKPIGPDLAGRADAYMLVCPETARAGNPHPIAATDAEYLEQFVAQGGVLILIHNDVHDPDKDTFDLKGMNLIAGKFGLEFLATSTRIMLIPIPSDHPVFVDVRGYLYGGGTTIRIDSRVRPRATVLLKSINPRVPGVLAARVRHGRGAVLALGDVGSLSNPDMIRSRIGQFEAAAQMFHCLLPEGPLPAYGWREGLTVKVKLRHELATAGYPEKLRVLDLPLDPAARKAVVRPRAMDFRAAGSQPDGQNRGLSAEKKAHRHRFTLARASWKTECELRIGAGDGRAFACRWIGADGKTLDCRLTPRGLVLDLSPGDGELTAWRWALACQIIVAPLDPQAQPGAEWTSTALAPLPHAQLRPQPITRAGTGRFRFEGHGSCRGRSCFVLSKTVRVDFKNLTPQEFVDPQYADYFGQQTVRLREAGQVCVVRTWIDETSRLPLRTELRASTGLIWTDRTMEDSFLSNHDWVTHEERTEHILYGTYGRTLVAEFEY